MVRPSLTINTRRVVARETLLANKSTSVQVIGGFTNESEFLPTDHSFYQRFVIDVPLTSDYTGCRYIP